MIYLTDAPKRHSGSRCTRGSWIGFTDVTTRIDANKGARVQTSRWNHLEMVLPHEIHIWHRLVYPYKKPFFFVCAGFKEKPLITATHGKNVKWEAHMAGHMSHLQNLTYDLFIMGQCHSTVKPPDLSAAQRLLCHPFSALQSVSHMWEACKWKIHWPDNCSGAIDKRKERKKQCYVKSDWLMDNVMLLWSGSFTGFCTWRADGSTGQKESMWKLDETFP